MSISTPPDGVRQIPSWTRKYAENRALPQLVLMLVWGITFFVLCWSASSGGQAYRNGQPLLFALFISFFLFSLAVNLYAGLRQQKLLRALNTLLYRSEGRVTVTAPPRSMPGSPARFLAPVLFGACVLGQVILGSNVQNRYQQPVSALYVIPFLLYIVWSGKSTGGIAVILWPILYALHAVLLVAGAPILFTGQQAFLNMLVPTAGYGILSFLAGHLYSRIALRRLRQLG